MMFVKDKDQALLNSIVGILGESNQHVQEQRRVAAEYLEKTTYAGMCLKEAEEYGMPMRTPKKTASAADRDKQLHAHAKGIKPLGESVDADQEDVQIELGELLQLFVSPEFEQLSEAERGDLRRKLKNVVGRYDKRMGRAAKEGSHGSSSNAVKEDVDLDFNDLLEYMLTADFEQLDEVSKETLKSYIPKAEKDVKDKLSNNYVSRDTSQKFKRDIANRERGLGRAVARMTKEEFDQLDEISKGTLGSYIKKATSSSDERSISNLSSRAADKLNNPVGNDTGEKDDHKSYLRSKGIARAVSRLTKEETEGTAPKTAREKDLAAKAEPKDKITHKDVMVARGVAKEEVELEEAQYGVNLGSRPVSGQKEYQGKEIKSFHPNKEKEAREFADKHGYVVKKNMLPAGNNITHTWDIHKEEVELEEAVGDNHLHVQHVGGGKYKVHAVGKHFADNIKVGEHLSDTELDDFSEMGGKIKNVKAPKPMKEARTLSSIVAEARAKAAAAADDEGPDADQNIVVHLKKSTDTDGQHAVKFSDGSSHKVPAGVAHKVLQAMGKLKPEDRAKVQSHIQQSHKNLMDVHKMIQ